MSKYILELELDIHPRDTDIVMEEIANRLEEVQVYLRMLPSGVLENLIPGGPATGGALSGPTVVVGDPPCLIATDWKCSFSVKIPKD